MAMVILVVALFNRILTWRYWLGQVRRVIMLVLYTSFFLYNPITDLTGQAQENKDQPQTPLNLRF